MPIAFMLNGKPVSLDVEPDMPLLWAIRDIAGLTGTKFGCGVAQCGACTVQIDGAATRSCMTALGDVAGKEVVTIEAIGESRIGRAVQEAWIAHQVPQCGYCQSGQIMSASALLAGNTSSQRCRHRLCDAGQYLPLRHLQLHPRRHQDGGQDTWLNRIWRRSGVVRALGLRRTRRRAARGTRISRASCRRSRQGD